MAVLSIQSHVVYGYAGNTAAVFPMQRLGREVWAINTVEFSNHTGYGAWRGKVLGAELAADLVTGLAERGVLGRCEAVLSGYLGDASVGRTIVGAVRRVRGESPKALYCCDPVMGDTGKGFYVKPDIPGIFKDELIPLADIVTPNQFELEALTGIKTETLAGARRAIAALHERGPRIVLVTSFRDNDSAAESSAMTANVPSPAGSVPPSAGGAYISMLASARAGDKSVLYRINTPELPLGAGVAGTGDLTASIFLSRYLETGDVKKTLELCTASVYGILEASFLKRTAREGPLDLLIVQAQEELSSPSHVFEAVKLNP
ncbi:pyridoxal kinase PdxY [Spirochaetia bacterium]|nr:pyridoxal kinase PdxY [Spirochaetia bacterium]